jgi:hypothetical protein
MNLGKGNYDIIIHQCVYVTFQIFCFSIYSDDQKASDP